MKSEIRNLPMGIIQADPDQPRKVFNQDDLNELAQSIQHNGLLNPITVRTVNGQADKVSPFVEYIIIAGERRFRAHQILNAETIECIIYSGKNGKELQLVENINRKDLNHMELVQAYRSYLDNGHTDDELAMVVGKPKNIINWLLNLEKCRPEVQHLVETEQMSMVVAIAVSKLTNNGQMRVLRAMQSTKLSVAECQALSDKVYATENQGAMFTEEPKLTAKELQARTKINGALDKACQALQAINTLEMDNPGISAQAIAEKLDITQEKVDLLYKLVGQFKKNLTQKRVATLC